MRGEAEARAFIEASTTSAYAPLLPEIKLRLATEVTPLWRATEEHLRAAGIEPPFWAFAWAGGQALARYVLDHPEIVRGRTVLDVASGGGLCALAAALSGALRVYAVDADPLAAVATRMNAEDNGVRVEARAEDILKSGGLPIGLETPAVILAGDVCYDRAMTLAVMPWLWARADEGALVLLGDPGRAYVPEEGLALLARYRVAVIDDVESTREKWGSVYLVKRGEGRDG